LSIPVLSRFYLNHYVSIKRLEKTVPRKIGFPSPPSSVSLHVTHACNFCCDHCITTSHPRAEWGLSFEIIARVIREIGEMGVTDLYISGGEPLVRQDLFDIIDLVNGEGVQVHLFTNGSLVERNRERLAKAKLHSVLTSVDGLEETNDRFRRHQGAFKQTFRALELFQEMGISSRMVNTVVHPGNLHELEELGDWIMTSAATDWRIALINPSGRAKGEDRLCLSDEQIRWILRFIRDRRKRFSVKLSEQVGYVGPWALEVRDRPFAPSEGLSYFAIMPTGDVVGSCVLQDRAYSEGNVKDQSLQEIWRNGFRRYREPSLPKACYGCRYLHACGGGTYGMRVVDRHCMKRFWEGEAANEGDEADTEEALHETDPGEAQAATGHHRTDQPTS
jgi:radical SAM protein with 4Fe4S-binding SPASM domain